MNLVTKELVMEKLKDVFDLLLYLGLLGKQFLLA